MSARLDAFDGTCLRPASTALPLVIVLDERESSTAVFASPKTPPPTQARAVVGRRSDESRF